MNSAEETALSQRSDSHLRFNGTFNPPLNSLLKGTLR